MSAPQPEGFTGLKRELKCLNIDFLTNRTHGPLHLRYGGQPCSPQTTRSAALRPITHTPPCTGRQSLPPAAERMSWRGQKPKPTKRRGREWSGAGTYQAASAIARLCARCTVRVTTGGRNGSGAEMWEHTSTKWLVTAFRERGAGVWCRGRGGERDGKAEGQGDKYDKLHVRRWDGPVSSKMMGSEEWDALSWWEMKKRRGQWAVGLLKYTSLCDRECAKSRSSKGKSASWEPSRYASSVAASCLSCSHVWWEEMSPGVDADRPLYGSFPSP